MRQTSPNPTPINPIPFAGGSILLVAGGRCIVRLEPLPEDAPDAMREYVNKYMATIVEMGHKAFVGDFSGFGPALYEIMAEWEAER